MHRQVRHLQTKFSRERERKRTPEPKDRLWRRLRIITTRNIRQKERVRENLSNSHPETKSREKMMGRQEKRK